MPSRAACEALGRLDLARIGHGKQMGTTGFDEAHRMLSWWRAPFTLSPEASERANAKSSTVSMSVKALSSATSTAFWHTIKASSERLPPSGPLSDVSDAKSRRGHKTGLRCAPEAVAGKIIDAPCASGSTLTFLSLV